MEREWPKKGLERTPTSGAGLVESRSRSRLAHCLFIHLRSVSGLLRCSVNFSTMHFDAMLKHDPEAAASATAQPATEEGREARPTVKSRTSPEARKRAHVERMLARAKKRSRQALRTVGKWSTRLTDLDRAQVAETQARLWHDEHPPQENDIN